MKNKGLLLELNVHETGPLELNIHESASFELNLNEAGPLETNRTWSLVSPKQRGVHWNWSVTRLSRLTVSTGDPIRVQFYWTAIADGLAGYNS